ncbi:uncharacterized protein LOC110023628 [Phalaenopsis equestris]|uniref:uncharacterized protein LOC110023628 n=1 Tax=Phalaenopsis equestris TaxID=78828 RepID=UPI0009E4D78B|nr:uncharacterized protein LOC110023628 [Phalaenopsis equestris]
MEIALHLSSPFSLLQCSKFQTTTSPILRRRSGAAAALLVQRTRQKNKTKAASFLRPHVLEISHGADIAEAVKNLTRNLGGYVHILTANGPVSSAVLEQPSCSSSSAADITLRGCYEIVSMASYFLGSGGGGEGTIAVTMAGMNGEVVGGIWSGALVAAGRVVVVVAELLNPTVHDWSEVKEIDSGEKRELRNEEEKFEMRTGDETASSEIVGVGGDNDEWCRNWLGIRKPFSSFRFINRLPNPINTTEMETTRYPSPLFTLLPPPMQQIPNDNLSYPPTAKRRRGRPPGSKNKTKAASFLRPHVLEISHGADIAEAVKNLTRNLGGYASILTANGPVSSAVLKQPSCSSAVDITLRGCYEIVSMTSYFRGGGGCGEGSIAVTMAGINGEVVGGILSGALVAAGRVVVVVAEFLNPAVYEWSEVKELDSREKRELRNEEEKFEMRTGDETASSEIVGDGGDNGEWCRNWFGQCERDVQGCFDFPKSGETGSGYEAGGYEGLLFPF